MRLHGVPPSSYCVSHHDGANGQWTNNGWHGGRERDKTTKRKPPQAIEERERDYQEEMMIIIAATGLV